MARIYKKTWPKYYQLVADGIKTFDFRLADFTCAPGDVLVLQEWDPELGQYTGREIEKEISLVTKQSDLEVWPGDQVAEHGYYILSFK